MPGGAHVRPSARASRARAVLRLARQGPRPPRPRPPRRRRRPARPRRRRRPVSSSRTSSCAPSAAASSCGCSSTARPASASTRSPPRATPCPRRSTTPTPLGDEPYTLEVSSPGVDRPLTLPRHWRRNVGRLVAVTARRRARGHRPRAVASTTSEVELEIDTKGRKSPPHDRARRRAPALVQVEFSRVADAELDEADDDSTDDDDERRRRSTRRRDRRRRRRDGDLSMDIDVSALKALVREKELSYDLVVDTLEQALLLAYHRTEGAADTARVRARPQDRPRDGLGARARRRRRPRPRVRRHPGRLRPRRRDHGAPGHPAAAARGRGRRDLRRVRRHRGRPRVRHRPAGQRPAGWSSSTSARIEAVLPPQEQVPGEKYTHGTPAQVPRRPGVARRRRARASPCRAPTRTW